MAAGLPCIVSPNVGAAADLIEHGVNGMILDFDHQQELIRSINHILDNPAMLFNMREKARETIKNKALLTHSIQGFLKVLGVSSL
jgi:glycosyltransferase involved in cell wall biosynthesis